MKNLTLTRKLEMLLRQLNKINKLLVKQKLIKMTKNNETTKKKLKCKH